MEKISENKEKGKVIIIDSDELKAEIRSSMGEVIGDGAKTIIKAFIEGICDNPVLERQSPEKTEEVPERPPENFLAIISGYLYMSLKELGYEAEDLKSIMQKIEIKTKIYSFEEALATYEESKKELFPLIIEGIIIPPECHDIWIGSLEFSNHKMATRISNALCHQNISYIRDFRDNNIDLKKVKNIGKGALDDFKAALTRAVNLCNE